MVTKGYGITVKDIDQSCPADLEPYEQAHNKELEEQDCMQHMWWGRYGLSAISVANEHCFAGKKAKMEYVKEPVLSEILESESMTEEEKYEKEIEKALLAEEQWIFASKQKGLPETII